MDGTLPRGIDGQADNQDPDKETADTPVCGRGFLKQKPQQDTHNEQRHDSSRYPKEKEWQDECGNEAEYRPGNGKEEGKTAQHTKKGKESL